jgi:hypothetical protein
VRPLGRVASPSRTLTKKGTQHSSQGHTQQHTVLKKWATVLPPGFPHQLVPQAFWVTSIFA